MSRPLVSGALGLNEDSVEYEREQQAQRSWDAATNDCRDAAYVYREVIGAHLRREYEAEHEQRQSRFV